MKPAKIVIIPSGGVEHSLERTDRKGVGKFVEGNCYAAAIGMLVAMMNSCRAGFGKAGLDQSVDERACVDPTGCFQMVTSTAGLFALIAHFVENEFDRFADSIERLIAGCAPSVGAFEGRTMG